MLVYKYKRLFVPKWKVNNEQREECKETSVTISLQKL